MFCSNCGNKLNNNEDFCSNCGNKVKNDINSDCSENNSTSNKMQYKLSNLTIVKKIKTINKKYFLLIIPIIFLLIILLFITNSRLNVLNNIEQDEKLKITFNGIEFYLGDKTNRYIENEYSYNTDNIDSYVTGDSISIQPFYYNNKRQFLATLYCPNSKKCDYDNTLLIKMNFHENASVVIDDTIKYGTYYSQIVKKYGDETGKFYQDENMLVWSLGTGKIGEPYFIIKFANSYFSDKRVEEIRVGIWWYEDEFEHTVIMEDVNEK